MKKMIFLVVLVGVLTIENTASFAYSAGEMCWLKKTKDGFVALRERPNKNAKLIHKLPNELYRVGPIGPIKKWVKVLAAVPEAVDNNQHFYGEGYVFSKLVDWQSCGNAG